ncbi:MAG: hypothetical protein AUI33_15170 [Ignavibacteria bacterium 13_1_40CM_2_61_4]|nr:MAG: hypothetical protein AUI33_15170 [Ignavibacteria bacterium 13_1_40CM_2_61_4]
MNRNRRLSCLAVLLLIGGARLLSQDRGFGLGIIIGEPTGISFKGWLNERNAIDGGLAWSFTRNGSFHAHADYLWHSFHVFQTQERIPLYFGIGARIKTGRYDDAQFGVRVPVGVGYLFKDAPVDLFFEIAPIVDLAPKTELEANAGLGVRIWFR